MKSLLSIRHLSVQFGRKTEKHRAVKDISFDIKKGELVAIVGESGSGKSVTALSLLQLLPKQSKVTGKAVFFQKNLHPFDLVHLSASVMHDTRGESIAMIFQEPMTSLNPVFTCGYQVMEVIMLHQEVSKEVARKKTIKLFESVKLPEPEKILGRYPHELSGGQKQRVMIAMAMSCNPTLLIADEPTTALDVTVQKTILELIKSLQQENDMGVIFITHDLGIVADIADKIVVMYKGEIVEQGDAREILLSPQHPYTKALLACRPAGQPKEKRLPVVSDFLELNGVVVSNGNQQSGIQVPCSDTGKPDSIILQVEDLHVHFPVKKNLLGRPVGFLKAVDGVGFTVHQGDILGLVGESGCGKTTLGRAILNLVKPTSGKIILKGNDITKMRPSQLRKMRKDIQVVFQDPYGSLNPRMTVGQAIMEPMKIHRIYKTNKERKEKVMELLEKVNLEPKHFNRYPHQFSGGQRQRICIARALALNPSFIIFDEAVSSLDVSVQAQVLNLISDLKKEFGFTAIFISHDLAVVHYICNRILVMNQGKIVEEGTADQVYYHPKNEYSKKLVNAIPGKTLFQG